jgi:dTDP-4-dehydrorhamnose reductase
VRILVLGGDGMLGHQVFKSLKDRHEVKVTLRQDLRTYQGLALFNLDNAFAGIDVRRLDSLMEVFADFHPQAVINGVGIVKQRAEAKAGIPSLEINALLPHRLAQLCRTAGARLIQMSTDCVFSGKTGSYTEDEPADADDLYGRTKLLGEVADTQCFTIRTSIVGRELARKQGLLEWFLAQRGTVCGYRKAIFSGFTTFEMSRIMERILLQNPMANGIYHISSSPISKYDLLTLIKKKLGLAIEIIPDEAVICDRSLDSTKFRKEFNYSPPSWEEMIEELNLNCADERS